MGLLDTLLSGENEQLINQLAQNVGLDSADLQNVIGKVAPALSQGVKQNMSSGNGLGDLLNMMNSGGAQSYLEHPEKLADPEAVEEGNAVLGQVLGSKEVSRNVASQAAEATGVDSDVIKKLLPMLATTVMGVLGNKTQGLQGGDLGAMLNGGGGSPMDLISSFLDADNDGEVADDLMDMAKKLF